MNDLDEATSAARKGPAISNGFRNRLYFPISVLLLLVLWQLIAYAIDSDLLPGPTTVAKVMFLEASNSNLLFDVLITLGRVTAAFIIAMALGMIIGIALGLRRRGDLFFDSWLIIALNLPALVVIVLCYVWFGLTEVAAIAAVAINKIPLVAVNLREGTRSLDPKLNEMGTLYQFSERQKLAHVILPQLAPYIAASARTGLALIWKIVLVVELLGRSNGVGFQIQLHFQLFDIAAILAYAIAFMIVIQIIEAYLIKPMERRANRWRGS